MAGEVRNFAVVFVLDASDLLVMFSEVDDSVALLTVSFHPRDGRPLLERRFPPFLVVFCNVINGLISKNLSPTRRLL